MTVTREQVELAGELLDKHTEHISILTKEHFDALMCEIPMNRTPISAALAPPAPLHNRPGAGEWLANNVVSPLNDSVWALPVGMGARDFYKDVYRSPLMEGFFTSHYEKTVNGQNLVILKGYAGQRELLKGTRYRSDNAKILEAGIGKQGIEHARPSIVGGIKVAFFAGVAIETCLWLFEEDHTFSDLLGGVVAEIGKGAVTAALSSLIYMAFGSVFATALVPVSAFILFGIAIGAGVNYLDTEFGIKDKFCYYAAAMLNWLEHNTGPVGTWTAAQIESLEQYMDEAMAEFRRDLNESIRSSDAKLQEMIDASAEASAMGKIGYSQQIRSESMNSGVMRLLRSVIGD